MTLSSELERSKTKPSVPRSEILKGSFRYSYRKQRQPEINKSKMSHKWAKNLQCVCAFLVCCVCTSFRLSEGAELAKPPVLISRCLFTQWSILPNFRLFASALSSAIIYTELFNTLFHCFHFINVIGTLDSALSSLNDIMFSAATFQSAFFFLQQSWRHVRYGCHNIKKRACIIQHLKSALCIRRMYGCENTRPGV